MKQFIKVYFSTILFFLIVGVISGISFLIINRDRIALPSFSQIVEDINNKEDENLTPLQKAMKNSSRINVLLVGKEHVRTDTIMVVSYDTKEKKANILSVPRDTYYEREGIENRQKKKINSIYQDEGIEGLIQAVENVTKLKIDNYATVDYDAVVAVVDLLGGIEVDVPFNMYYSDPYDTPPLIIDIQAGKQVLNGEKALKFLRFRHNSDGSGYPDGDLGRIKTQQEFIKLAVNKALGLKLPSVIEESFKYIDTDFTLTELLSLATNLVGFSMENLEATTIDNYTKTIDNLSYVIPNEDGISEYVNKLYNVESENTNEIIDIGN